MFSHQKKQAHYFSCLLEVTSSLCTLGDIPLLMSMLPLVLSLKHGMDLGEKSSLVYKLI